MSTPRLIAACTATALASYLWTGLACADPDGALVNGSSQGDQASAAILVGRAGQAIQTVPLTKTRSGATRRWLCHFYDLPSMASGLEDVKPVTPQDKLQYVLICNDQDTGEEINKGVITYDAANPAASLGDDGALAGAIAGAVSSVQAQAPSIATSPPQDRTQVVGVKTWFWTDGWEVLSDFQGIPGYRISVAASAAEIVVNTGDNRTFTCDQATAIPWSKEEVRQSQCSHAYWRKGRYDVTVSMRYRAVRWVAYNDFGGVIGGADLDPIESAPTAFTLTVQETQAVITVPR